MKRAISITNGLVCIITLLSLVALVGCTSGNGGSSDNTTADIISSSGDITRTDNMVRCVRNIEGLIDKIF